MAIPNFYHPQLDVQDKAISLDSNEAAHAVKSRRLGVGQEVRVFNGKGLVGKGKLSVIERRDVIVEFESLDQEVAATQRISIAVAIPKGDRQKVMVDMLTQLGVFEIIPLSCERSITKFSDKISEKWSRVAIEACKQSQNGWLPRISKELSLDQLLSCTRRNFVLANADGISPQKIAGGSSEITVIIGPEGGFSELEFTKLSQLAVPSMRVGAYILRTETAAIVAASVLSL